ncbi:MAG: DUF1553 domain-containing protein [Pirellulaceae bacterium]|nr:DUF1553 domain-containing protein [Pirellulaceae bacterium]
MSPTVGLADEQIRDPAPSEDRSRVLAIGRQALAVLRSRCMSCHGPEKAESGLRVDSMEALLTGGDRGSAIDRMHPHRSWLIRSILGEDDLEMPPKLPLSASEIALLKQWVQMGAVWEEPDDAQAHNPLNDTSQNREMTESETPAAEHLGDAWTDPRNPIVRLFGGERLELWSFRPIQRSSLPPVRQLDWIRGDLDRFPLSALEAMGAVPPKSADRRTLARRLFFDLTGLPPTIEQVEQFVQGTAADDTQRLVDQLLESPRFGEHWGRWWLDAVRYSDSNGFDWDEFRPQAWRFRDYVIRSLNADKPLDQFIREQLAGDELLEGPPQTPREQDRLIATGFLRMGPHDNAAGLFNEQDRSRDELLTDLVETTGSALLGMTLSCCRCHDHKFDPLSHEDYFRLRAFFAGVQFADDLPIDLPEQLQAIAQHNKPLDTQAEELDQSRKALVQMITRRVRQVESDTSATVLSSSNTADSNSADDSTAASELSEKELMAAANQSERQQMEALQTELDALRQRRLKETTAMLMIESSQMPMTYVLNQGDYKSPRQPVLPGVFSALNPNPLSVVKPLRAASSGRRLTLAEWIVSNENPLTARVIVNRVWQNLFGEGIVRTPDDFGLSGLPPDQPELLDWLAAEFVEQGWSLKRLIRTIVLSAHYQQVAHYSQPSDELAPLVRRPRRLSAEQLRDAVLSVSGLLTDKLDGPPMWPDLPREVLEANPAFLDDNELKVKGWYPSPAQQQYCRSIFLVQKRNTRLPFMEAFDQPENSVPCARRRSSVVAPQALVMLNGPLSSAAARELEQRLNAIQGSDLQRLEQLFRWTLQRSPTVAEVEQCLPLLNRSGWGELSRAILNVNEFAYLD